MIVITIYQIVPKLNMKGNINMGNNRAEIPVPALYEAIEPKDPKYPYFIPAEYAAGGFMGDCVAVDEYGNPDPAFSCASPIHASLIGKFFCLLSEIGYE